MQALLLTRIGCIGLFETVLLLLGGCVLAEFLTNSSMN